MKNSIGMAVTVVLFIFISIIFGLILDAELTASAQAVTVAQSKPTSAQDYVSLKEYFNLRFEQMQRDVALAYAQMEKRLDGMNEFRATLSDQGKTFMTRTEMEAKLLAVEADLRMLRESKAVLEGKASQQSVNDAASTAFTSLLISAMSALIAIMGIILRWFKPEKKQTDTRG